MDYVQDLIKQLDDPRTDVRFNAARALENFVSKCNSIEKLKKAQAVIEKSFKKWFDKNRNTIDPLKMALIAKMTYNVSRVVVTITKRKAELAKAAAIGGGILLGEVVKPPGDRGRGGVYMASKNTVMRNGV